MEENHKERQGKLGAALIGVAVGMVLGAAAVVFANKETREKVEKKAKEWRDKGKKKLDETEEKARGKLAEKLTEVKERVEKVEEGK